MASIERRRARLVIDGTDVGEMAGVSHDEDGNVSVELVSGVLEVRFFERMVDAVTARLVERIDRVAGELAGAAIEQPKEALVLAALADRIEEKGLPRLAAEVRRLRVETGDVLVVRHPDHVSSAARDGLRKVMGKFLDDLLANGVSAQCLVLPESIGLEHWRLRDDKET